MHEFTKQRIAAAQVMIQKRERRANGERMQPERQLRQLYRHRVEIDAVDYPLEHNAPHEVAIVQMLVAHLPAVLFGFFLDVSADALDRIAQR